jgi:hypothetical protein
VWTPFDSLSSPAAFQRTQEDALRDAAHIVEDAAERIACTCGGACAVHGDRLGQIADLLQRIAPKATIAEDTTLQAEPAYIVQSHGRRYNRIWCAAPATVVIDMADSTSLDLVAGWNAIDASDGARITSASAITVRIEYTDYPIR